MKTKFNILVSLITIVTFLLAGCSNTAAATVSASNGLSGTTKLALGTLKLEGTSQAVTAAQANELITLWEGYESLSNSDTTSQVELDALVKQIQGIMTTDQIKAIEAMGLTDQSVNEVMQSLGSSANVSAPASTPNASALSQAAPAGGAGGMPSDRGGIPMGDITGGMTAQSTPATTQASSNAGSMQVNTLLIQAVIKMLETRSQTTG
jgi:hypothetical protein